MFFFFDVSHSFIIYQENPHTQLINLNTIQCYHTKRNNQQSKCKLFPQSIMEFPKEKFPIF